MAIGRRVLRMEEATSTNDVAKELGKQGEAEGTVVLARTQTEGRGRMGKHWSSREGGLYMSVLLRPRMRSEDVLRLTVLSCLPVAEAIEDVASLEVQVKWPNDVLVNGRKAGGILVEGVSRGAELDFVVLGIGINVNTPPDEIGAEDATSLSAESGKRVDTEGLFQSLVAHLERFYSSFSEGVLDEGGYIQRSSVLGHRVEAIVGRERFVGKALYLAPDGALVLRTDEGLVLRLAWVNETSIVVTNNEEMAGSTVRKD